MCECVHARVSVFLVACVWALEFDLDVILIVILAADLREDKEYLIDHPGATPISIAQASYLHNKGHRSWLSVLLSCFLTDYFLLSILKLWNVLQCS